MFPSETQTDRQWVNGRSLNGKAALAQQCQQ